MSRSLLSLLALAAFLGTAPAGHCVLDPNDNVIGAYFDLDADVDCIEGVGLNTQLPIHIILTRPTFGELYGFELGLEYGSNLILLGQSFANSQVINVGTGGSFIVGFGSPTYTSEATLLMTLDMLHMGTASDPSFLVIHGSEPSSLDPAYPTLLLAGEEIMSTALHSESRPIANLVNGRCGFEDEGRTWDGVKTLYRR